MNPQFRNPDPTTIFRGYNTMAVLPRHKMLPKQQCECISCFMASKYYEKRGPIFGLNTQFTPICKSSFSIGYSQLNS